MSTRSRIGRINPGGSITSVYCHWDGYPDHHLPILSGHYTKTAKINKLLALGSLSTLAAQIGKQHDFEDRSHPTWCKAHGRDRQEKDSEAITNINIEAFAVTCHECWAEYAYLWDGNRWSMERVIGRPVPQLESISAY